MTGLEISAADRVALYAKSYLVCEAYEREALEKFRAGHCPGDEVLKRLLNKKSARSNLVKAMQVYEDELVNRVNA